MREIKTLEMALSLARGRSELFASAFYLGLERSPILKEVWLQPLNLVKLTRPVVL